MTKKELIKQVMREMGSRGGKKNSKEHMKAISLLAVAARKKKRELEAVDKPLA